MEVDESRHVSMLDPMVQRGDSINSLGGLASLFDRRRVLVCVGSGGVGKTTTAAALALAAAESGRKTLCLTIDPARRLAQSLGLESFSVDEMEVSQDWMQAHGVTLRAPLTVMMLDAGRTFDELIMRHASSEGLAASILKNRVYQTISRGLAGTQAYMAMEKVQEVEAAGQYDLILLDTPPGERVLDFFDAPEKMQGILDSPVTRVLARSLTLSKFSLAQQSLRVALRALSKVTGGAFLQELAELLALIRDLFGGFADRAERVSQKMRGEEFGYLLVTAQGKLTLHQAQEMAQSLRERRLRLDAWVLNRAPRSWSSFLSPGELEKTATFQQLGLPGGSSELIVRAAEQEQREQTLLAQSFQELTSEEMRRAMGSPLWVQVPLLAGDIHEPQALLNLASHLLSPQPLV